MSKINIIPIFVPHVGCPNDCVFCNQRRISGVENFDISVVRNIVETHLTYFKNSEIPIEIAFYGGSFTAIDEALQEELLSIGHEYIKLGVVNSLRISTRPDAIDVTILKRLKQYGVTTIELGVQSMDEEVLLQSKRGHSINAVINSSKLIKDNGFKHGLQQMVGLPGDSKGKSIYTTREIIKLKPDFVRIYPTLVIVNTELEDMYKSGVYTPLSLEEAVDIVSEIILLYNTNNINIIRVGLQSSDNLQLNKDVVAGPLHDAFRELAESELLFKLIDYSSIELCESTSIYGNNAIAPLLVGQKSENKNKIINKYKLKDLKILRDSSLENEIIIDSCSSTIRLDLKELSLKYRDSLESKCI